MPTLDDVNDKLDKILTFLRDMPELLQLAKGQVKIVQLSDLSETLGLLQAGEFRAGNSAIPGHGFSGVRIGYPPFTYGGMTWNIAGVNNDTLQFGLRASDGVALAGGGALLLKSTGLEALSGSTPSFNVFSTNQTYNSESVGAGDVMIGDNSTGEPNLFWDASVGQLQFRSGTTVLGVGASNQMFGGVGAWVEINESSPQETASGTGEALSFVTEVYDDAGFWSSGAPTRLTVPTDGRYRISIAVWWEANSSGTRDCGIVINGASPPYSLPAIISAPPSGSKACTQMGTWEQTLDADDYIELWVLQDSGGNLDVDKGAMQIRRIR